MRKHSWFWIIGGAVAAALLGGCIWLILRYYPVIEGLTRPENLAVFQERLRSFGLLGVAVLLGIQLLQVLSGVIPALPIQIAAGATYGAAGGLAICLAGIFVGSSLVFTAVKRFGQPLIDRVFPAERQQKLAFLHDADRLNLIVFILYLIPAMPKDVFNYLAALTPLTLRRYLAITLVARTPTILCLTFASNALIEGNYLGAVVVFCVSATLGVGAMLFHKRIMGWLKGFRRH